MPLLMKFGIYRVMLIAGLLSILSACQSIAYYSQSVVGHSRLMLARQPVDQAIKIVPEEIAHKLRLVKELRVFAVEQLALPNNKSYSSYVAIERDYPVWVVVAAPKFSLQPKQWCYWVIGCASYRGYFSEDSALRYAAKLQKLGYDTHVGGASAYSTLGWFNDPLLPSMMQGSDAAFTELIFHELAHQVYYRNGDSGLNEAFATVVGEQGALLWMQNRSPEQLLAYQQRRGAQRDFAAIVEPLKIQLSKIYGAGKFDPAERVSVKNASANQHELEQRKDEAWQAFQESYQHIKSTRWQNKGYYDALVFAPLNNARLAAFSTYTALIPKLEALFHACDSDFSRFYDRLRRITKSLNDTACQ